MVKNVYISRRNEFKIKKAIHSETSIMITLSGEFQYTEGDITRHIKPFSPIVYKKGNPFERTVIHPIEYIMITLLEIDPNTDTFLEFSDGDRIRLNSTVEHLKDAILNDRGNGVIEHFANDILLTAGMNKIQNHKDTDFIVDYIKEHFCEKLTLDSLAEIANYSKQTLITKFKREHLMTPVEYITGLRIKKAKELLVNSNLSIAAVAEKCGFDNPYYFSNTFKKHIGISPLQYRKQSIL
ncbi:MAG: helix-turn-helix transcriptional regulator [Clostridia bacterium]|nr:helix-turn-helix transcriptional regulator [Clostridia bacterium]MBO5912649.1 helix-turn-helix transcriptional regulator [Clostridia bacterium]